jgi:colanic acid/amylovoran biosynthesis glycosyltransferase
MTALSIVYVVSRWNQETETFVRREVAAALDDGVRVQVISLQAPGASDGIVDDSRIRIVVPSVAAVVRGFCAAIFASPGATISSLLRILRYGRPGTWKPHLQAWAAALGVSPQTEDFDVALAHFAWLSSTTADVLGRVRGRPFAIFVHAHAIYEHRCQDGYLTDRLRRAAAVFVESDLIADDVRDWHGVEPTVMRMGVPASFVVETPRDTTADDPAVVVSVGALRAKKGHDVLIRAVSSLPKVRLVIAGEGPERRSLTELITKLDVEDSVELLGHRSLTEIRGLLDQATIFCLASRLTPSGDRDGVPNVLIEAMARGVPVIASAVSGIPDLLGDGCGVVVAPENVDAVRQAIIDLTNSPEAARAQAAAALGRITADYTTEANWRRLAAALSNCAPVESDDAAGPITPNT